MDREEGEINNRMREKLITGRINNKRTKLNQMKSRRSKIT